MSAGPAEAGSAQPVEVEHARIGLDGDPSVSDRQRDRHACSERSDGLTGRGVQHGPVAGVEHPPASAARSGAEPHDYQPWIDNDRRLRELLARLEAHGAAALDADPGWQRKARHAPAETSQTTP